MAKQTEELLLKYSKDTEEKLLNSTKLIDSKLTELADSLEKSVLKGIKSNEQFLQTETSKLGEQLKATFTTLEASAKEKIRSNVENEFIAVRKVIETYRQERFSLIDNQIISLVEDTASIALHKTMSLSDHTDLIYKALDEAKSKNVFS